MLGVDPVIAKVDTGARTSALHATHISTFDRKGRAWVKFRLYDNHRIPEHYVWCQARLVDIRAVRNSGGSQESRPVIRTRLVIGTRSDESATSFSAEFTLVERSDMLLPMLLGRTALRASKSLVNPARSFLLGRHRRRP